MAVFCYLIPPKNPYPSPKCWSYTTISRSACGGANVRNPNRWTYFSGDNAPMMMSPVHLRPVVMIMHPGRLEMPPLLAMPGTSRSLSQMLRWRLRWRQIVPMTMTTSQNPLQGLQSGGQKLPVCPRLRPGPRLPPRLGGSGIEVGWMELMTQNLIPMKYLSATHLQTRYLAHRQCYIAQIRSILPLRCRLVL